MPKVTIIGPVYLTASLVRPTAVDQPSGRIWDLKPYDSNMPITKDNYHYIILNGNVHSGNITLPSNPENGENYTFIYFTGPNNINLVFAPKSIVSNGFNQFPINRGSANFVFTIFYDSASGLWQVYYTSNN